MGKYSSPPLSINTQNIFRVQYRDKSLSQLSEIFLIKHVNDSEGAFGNLKALNEPAFLLRTPTPAPLLVSQDVIFNSTLLQLHFRESQAETEVQPCHRIGKQVTRNKAAEKREYPKVRHGGMS